MAHGRNETGSAQKLLHFQNITETPRGGQSPFLLPPMSANPEPLHFRSPTLTPKQTSSLKILKSSMHRGTDFKIFAEERLHGSTIAQKLEHFSGKGKKIQPKLI